MKKLLNYIVITISLVVISNIVMAQTAIDTDILKRKKEIAEIFKTPIVASSNEILMQIKPRAVRHFLNNFTEAENENWSVITHGFRASFMNNGVINSIYYDTKGYWSEIIRKYPEEKLPHEVRELFKNKYFDNTFIYAESIEMIQSDKEPTFAVYVENAKSLKCLRIYAGMMELVKEIVKK